MITESKILKFAVMRKIAILFTTMIFLCSCETEFEVNAPAWKDVSIIYGLLEANKDTQYVKIYRGFLGEQDALIMASHPDSIYYNAEDAQVLNEYTALGSLKNIIFLKDTILGEFIAINGASSIPNKAYYFDEPLNDAYEYELIIIKNDTIKR